MITSENTSQGLFECGDPKEYENILGMFRNDFEMTSQKWCLRFIDVGNTFIDNGVITMYYLTVARKIRYKMLCIKSKRAKRCSKRIGERVYL